MTKPDKRLEGMIEDALARVALLGRPDAEVERDAQLPQAFLAKTRDGRNRHPSSTASWAKLRAWLAGQPLVSKGATTDVPTRSQAQPAAPSSGEAPIPGDISAAFSTVGNADELLVIDRMIAAKSAQGGIEARLSEVLQGWSRELRQVFELREEHKAREELLNLVPMTADQAKEWWESQEDAAARALAAGEAAAPPEKKAPPA